jgi:MOSC domain-containing protein YiiM
VRVLSVNIGRPQEREWKGLRVLTSIFKYPVEGEVRVGSLDLEGDEQADLSVHGGADKAVYLYPSEHYAWWRRELDAVPEPGLAWGAFGENLTTEGLLEADVLIGDQLRIGTAEFMVTQPRMPCNKLAARFGRPGFIREFLESRRSGFYLSVIREGELSAGDAVVHHGARPHGITVTDVVTAYATGMEHPDLVRRLAALPELHEGLRTHFRKRLEGDSR